MRYTARRFLKIRQDTSSSNGNPFTALQLRGAHPRKGAGQTQEHFIDVGLAHGERRGEAQAIGMRRVEQQAFVQRGIDYGIGRML